MEQETVIFLWKIERPSLMQQKIAIERTRSIINLGSTRIKTTEVKEPK